MDKQIFQIQAEIVRDKSLVNGARQFVIETQENINPEHLHRLMILENKVGWFTFSSEMIEATDLTNLAKIDPALYPNKKTPSKRQQAVIFRLWEQAGSPGEFRPYYEKIMEKIIEQLKERLS
jgi:hypothetical protein